MTGAQLLGRSGPHLVLADRNGIVTGWPVGTLRHTGDLGNLVPPGSTVHLHPSAALSSEWVQAGRDDGWTVEARSAWFWQVSIAGSVPVTVVDGAASSGAAGPWSDEPDFHVAAAGLRLLEGTLGRAWESTVARTAQGLILDGHPRQHGGRALDRDAQVPAVCSGNVEGPWSSWRRPFTPTEELARYVHLYDANAQYLAPWQTTELGVGELVHDTEGGVPLLHRPGFWRLAEPLPDVLDDEWLGLLPRPWGLGQVDGDLPVYSSVTLNYAAELLGPGAVRVVEGWYWPERSRYLRPAGERLRAARGALLDHVADGAPGADLALTAVKSLYRVMTGRLQSTRVGAEGSPWRRPDWAHLLKATARVNLHRRLDNLAAAPWAVATDGLLFAGDIPGPRVFADKIRLPLGTGLGKFTHKGTWELTAELRQELDQARGAVGALRVLSEFATVTP